jgi:hypothetical protein
LPNYSISHDGNPGNNAHSVPVPLIPISLRRSKAAHHATGKRVRELPITIDKLMD